MDATGTTLTSAMRKKPDTASALLMPTICRALLLLAMAVLSGGVANATDMPVERFDGWGGFDAAQGGWYAFITSGMLKPDGTFVADAPVDQGRTYQEFFATKDEFLVENHYYFLGSFNALNTYQATYPWATFTPSPGFGPGFTGHWRITVGGVTPPPKPGPLPTPPPDTGPDHFCIQWSAVAGAAGYRLDLSLSSNFSTYVIQDRDVGNVTSYCFWGLIPGTTYYYRLRAYNSAGTGASSDTAVVTLPTAALPNLTFTQLAGWSDKIVVSSVTGTHTHSSPLLDTQTLYVDFSVINSGNGTAPANWIAKCYVDGAYITSWLFNEWANPASPGATSSMSDGQIGPLAAGTHVVKIVLDTENAVTESNEYDNSYERTITVNGGGAPNLTLPKLGGWTSTVVVSTVTGTHADSTTYLDTDTLYVDYTPGNDGTAAVPASWKGKLYVDGVLKHTAPFASGLGIYQYYGDLVDIPIGKLAAGTHTIRVVLDEDNEIAELNESDNAFERTVVVGALPLVSMGPIINPANGHFYYGLETSTWTDAEKRAVAMGGHLTAVNNAVEQGWLMGEFKYLHPLFWLGLTDAGHEGTWTWTSGESFSYNNWKGGEPNGGTVENYGQAYSTWVTTPGYGGYWNDVNNVGLISGYTPKGIVEIVPPENLGLWTEPGSRTIRSGQTATITVHADGNQLSYQWFQGASGDVSTPVGTNTASFTTPPLSSTTSYWVRVYTVDAYAWTDSSVTTITVLSADANLANLTLSTGVLSPVFSSGITGYTSTVPNGTTATSVTATVAQANGKLKVNNGDVASGVASGAIPLSVGANTINILVTAEDGWTVKSYSVTVIRAPSSNAALAGLALSAGTLSPAFAAGTLSYAAAVSNATTGVSVLPIQADANANVKVNGTAVVSGNPSGLVALNVGPNVITVLVTAQDGSTTKTYSVTVTRAGSANADLTGLAIQSGSLSPAFAAGTLSYSASVPYLTSVLGVTPTTAHGAATVKVAGTAVVSGGTANVPLVVGANAIAIVVTAEDGLTKKTYTINATRADPAPKIAVLWQGNYHFGSGTQTSVPTCDVGSSTVDASLTLKNEGTASLTGISASFIGTNAAEFQISNLPASLAPDASVAFTVTFTPAALQTRTATLRILSNDPNVSQFDLHYSGAAVEGVGFAKDFGIVNEGTATYAAEIVRTSGVGTVSVRVKGQHLTTNAADVTFADDGQVVTFAEGELNKWVEVAVAADTTAEPNEDFQLQLYDPQGGAQIRAWGHTLRIVEPGDIAKPSLTLTAPKANLTVHEKTVALSGRASDNRGIGKVLLAQNSGPYEEIPVNLAVFGGSTLDFYKDVTLAPGINTLAVKAIDTSGKESTVMTRRVTYEVYARLTVSTDGPGTLPRPFPGFEDRKAGFSYTLTAKPATGYVFDGWSANDWTGTGVTAEAAELAKLTFKHHDGLGLTARFIANPFTPAVVGKFNGLLFPHAEPPSVPAQTGNHNTGLFTATVTGTGSFTGTLKIDGAALPVKGVFDNGGMARFGTARLKTLTLKRTHKADLHLTLSLDMTGATGKMSGTVWQGAESGIAFESRIDADRAHYSAAAKVPEGLAGKTGKPYTLVFRPREAPNGGLAKAGFPQGHGYANATVKPDGTVSLTGKLADHTSVTASGLLSASNRWPLYAQLYAAKGCVAGWVTLDEMPIDTDLMGTDVVWIRPIGTGQWYPQGWPQGILVDAIGCKYLPAPANVFPGLAAVDAMNGNAVLTFADGGLVAPLSKFVNLSDRNAATKAPVSDASFTFKLAPATGVISGSFNPGAGGKSTYQGVILQKSANLGGYGYFMSASPRPVDGKGESGSVLLMAR